MYRDRSIEFLPPSSSPVDDTLHPIPRSPGKNILHYLNVARHISIDHWWLIRVTLVVAFGFLPQNFGKVAVPTNSTFVILEWWGQSEMVGTINPYML